MTQENKELLLRDLSSRLPYGVKIDNMGEPSGLVSINHKYRIIVEIAEGDKNPSFNSTKLDVLEIEDAKPYLFPMSSMTEEQNLEFLRTCQGGNANFPTLASFDWLNKNHFDYRGLIEKGLAIDATRLNIY